MRVLVTGSSGLIGSAVVEYFDPIAEATIGVDNNMRMDFFGPGGDTTSVAKQLQTSMPGYVHHDLDVRDRGAMDAVVAEARPDLIVHCAGQPSHDLSRERPVDDFDVNAVGTLNLLEAARLHVPDCVFVFMSTNKVYGDAPNELELVELETRFDYADPEYANGIDETLRIDASTHSVFGASKTAADVLVQEYGRYFGMRTACLRVGCMTGPAHAGVELHGFLSHLVKVAVRGDRYTIYGYKGKQVRDNIHSVDVAAACHAIYENPKIAAVYNMGGGRANSVSMIEAISKLDAILGRELAHDYDDINRVGDHICYISDLSRFESDYPTWKLTKDLDSTLDEMVRNEHDRMRSS